MPQGYVSIDTLFGLAGFAFQVFVFVVGGAVAWGKLSQVSKEITKAVDAVTKRVDALEQDNKDRSKDLARFATIEAKLESMGADLHRIATALDARPRQAAAHTPSPDIIAGLRVLASLAGKEIPTH